MSKMRNKIIEILKGQDNFLILTHTKPDGDAFGSSLGLLNVLQENNKTADLFLLDSIPNNYKSFIEKKFITGTKLPDFRKYSYCICLDCANSDRLEIGESKFDDILIPIINIDHHPDNKCFGQYNLINPNAAASAEIVKDIIDELLWDISSKTATLLMLGLIMDTGCFKFNNTNQKTFAVASDLFSKNAEYQKIIDAMFFSKPLKLIQLTSDLIYNNTQLYFNGQYASAILTQNMLHKHNLKLKDTEDLIDSIRIIEGVKVATLIIEKDDEVKISLRSKDEKYSVGKIARSLGGGGHELAAGVTIKNATIIEVEKKLKEHLIYMK